MTYAYPDAAADSQLCLIAADMNPGMYDSTSSESSASSLLNGYENIYVENGFVSTPSYPIQCPTAQMGLMPVKLNIEALYEDRDRRRRKKFCEQSVLSHVKSRRRAQNRASQQAFRDRKQKYIRDLERRLAEMETRHNDLSRLYESLFASVMITQSSFEIISQS